MLRARHILIDAALNGRVVGNRSGLAALEFALVLPLFLLLIIGIMQLGQLFWTQTALQHAVEMAARCATVNTTTCGTATQIRAYAATQAYGMVVAPATFTVTTPTCGNNVAATSTFTFLTSLFPIPTITLRAQSCYPR
jgi:Flp pilus assembly protein TadG